MIYRFTLRIYWCKYAISFTNAQRCHLTGVGLKARDNTLQAVIYWRTTYLTSNDSLEILNGSKALVRLNE